jgi:hypothetical protein
MTKFLLALIAIGVATLIGAFVTIAFELQGPILHRYESLHAAPKHERTLTPRPESGGAVASPSGRFWPGVGYPAIPANRGDGSRLRSLETMAAELAREYVWRVAGGCIIRRAANGCAYRKSHPAILMV